MTWVSGDLHDRAALERLVDDADAVIHVAGVISAHTADAFEKGNVDGTLAMLAAATAGGLRRFVHVSSLAAREPNLSLYGASKASAEGLVHGSGLDWSIVRPPAVYGPGDKETLELFRMAKLGVMLMPPKGRVSVVHVDDLCPSPACARRAGSALNDPHRARRRQVGRLDPPRFRSRAWRMRWERGRRLSRRQASSFASQLAPISCSAAIAPSSPSTAPLISRTATGWSSPSAQCRVGLWQPAIETIKGLRQTADWYRQQGWL